jgi:hypothetical protein
MMLENRNPVNPVDPVRGDLVLARLGYPEGSKAKRCEECGRCRKPRVHSLASATARTMTLSEREIRQD